MSKDFNSISYEDYSATMLTNQVDTIAKIDDLVIENQEIIYSTSIHSENHIMHDIFQIVKKKITFEEFVLFILIIIIFIIIIMSSSLLFFIKKRQFNIYHFKPDYKISIVDYRDIIDTDEKLEVILMDSSIVKEYTPKKGDFIIQKDDKIWVESYEKISKIYNIHPLNHNKTYTYTNNKYKFIPTVITESKIKFLAEKIKTKDVRNALIKNNIETICKEKVKIGSFVWINFAGQFQIMLNNNNISREHLTDVSKNNIIDVNNLI
ncbi:MAG: hypothetical protein KFW21_03775 [Spirochaetota bacterium]|nr:hypothetical protein [Spirochaetota bacterium]